jgi:hypothetical protein
MLSVLAGCGVDQGSTGQNAPTAPAVGETGEVKQLAQFADATLINEVNLQNMSVLLDADGQAIDVQVFYSGDKTTDTGRTPSAPVLIQTVHLETDTTAKIDINLNNAAFKGNYGAVFLDAIGVDPLNVFQTYVQSGQDIWSAGGSAFNGSAFRIPYWTGCAGIVAAITNTANIDFDIQFANIGHTDVTTIHLVPFSTYVFNSQAEHWTTTGTNAVQVTTNNGGTIYLSAYELRGLAKYRVVPVKTAPWP